MSLGLFFLLTLVLVAIEAGAAAAKYGTPLPVLFRWLVPLSAILIAGVTSALQYRRSSLEFVAPRALTTSACFACSVTGLGIQRSLHRARIKSHDIIGAATTTYVSNYSEIQHLGSFHLCLGCIDTAVRKTVRNWLLAFLALGLATIGPALFLNFGFDTMTQGLLSIAWMFCVVFPFVLVSIYLAFGIGNMCDADSHLQLLAQERARRGAESPNEIFLLTDEALRDVRARSMGIGS